MHCVRYKRTSAGKRCAKFAKGKGGARRTSRRRKRR
jgi:hypothetical protein